MTADGRALPAAATDGVPCRRYEIGQHAAALSRMVLWRLVLSAVIAGILTPTLSIIVALALMGASSSNPAGLLGRILGSPVLLGIVLANNFLQMFVFWELVGVSSYLLIGFWYERSSAADACKKAFLTNRLGDFGFILGIILEAVALRPLYSRDHLDQVLGTFALILIFNEAVIMIWGTEPQYVATPPLLAGAIELLPGV